MSVLRRWNGATWEAVGSADTVPAVVVTTLPAFAQAPAGPVRYQTYFDTTLDQQVIWNGATWQTPDGTVVNPGVSAAIYPSETLFPSSQTYPLGA